MVVMDTTAGASGNNGIFLRFNDNRTMYIEINFGTGGQSVCTGNTGVIVPNDSDNYHDFLITYDQALSSANCKFYIDGSLSASLNKTGNVPSVNDCVHAYIGTYDGANQMLNCDMQKLIIMNKVQTGIRG